MNAERTEKPSSAHPDLNQNLFNDAYGCPEAGKGNKKEPVTEQSLKPGKGIPYQGPNGIAF